MNFFLQKVIVFSIVILAVWIIDKLICKKAGYRWRKFLWIFIALGLITPFSITNGISNLINPVEVNLSIPASLSTPLSQSISNSYNKDTVNFQANSDANHSTADNTNKPNDTTNNISPSQDENNAIALPDVITSNAEVSKASLLDTISIIDIFLIAWLSISAVIVIARVIQYTYIKRNFIKNTTICNDSSILDCEKGICNQMGIQKPIPIRISSNTKEYGTSPIIFGYIKPFLILPDTDYSTSDLEYILRHELTHYVSKDLLYKLIMLFICDVLWINPIFRLMKKMSYNDIEFVCDKKVTKNMSINEKKRYSTAILRAMANTRTKGMVFSTGFSTNKKRAKERFENIFSSHSRKVSALAFTLCATLIVAGTGCVAFKGDKDNTKSDTPISEKAITVDANIFGENAQTIIAEYNAANNGVKVECTNEDWYFNGSNISDAPTMFAAGNYSVNSLINEEAVADITDVIAKHGWTDKFSDAVKASITDSNGKIYAIPFSYPYAYGLLVNKKLFADAGLVDTDGTPILPTTWDEFVTTCNTIKEKTGAYGVSIPATEDELISAEQYLNIAYSFGLKDIITKDENGIYTSHLDSEEAINAMQFLKDLKWTHNAVNLDPEADFITAFNQMVANETAMYISANDTPSILTDNGMASNDIYLGALPYATDSGKDHYTNLTVGTIVFSKDATAEEIDAAISLLEAIGLTPTFNDAAKANIDNYYQQLTDTNAPIIPTISLWNDSEVTSYVNDKLANAGANEAQYSSFFDALNNTSIITNDSPRASELFIQLSKAITTIMNDENADVTAIMQDVNSNYQATLNN